MTQIQIRHGKVERIIGDGAPAFLIGEISANHDGDLNQALALIDLAAEAGFDAVKLQTYTADSLTVPTAHPSARVDPVWGAHNLYELYSKAAMPMEFHKPLFERIAAHGMIPFTTLYDPLDLEFVETLGTSLYKIASFEISHFPLLRAVAQTGKPIILSTGTATLGEVEEAVETLAAANSGPVVLLHCCSAYPTPPEAANLRALSTLREAFRLPVGFSDHTEGPHIPLAAVTLGACAIEKHITNDPGRPGPDHRFSASPSQMRDLVRYIRDAEKALGDGRKRVQEVEAVNRAVGRRSIYVIADVAQGEVLNEKNVRVIRPGAGLHPRYWDQVIGSRARRPLAAGNPLHPEDME